MPYSEGIGFIADARRPRPQDRLRDLRHRPRAGHQWWAHQVIGADDAGHDHARRDARPVLGADRDGEHVRAGQDPQVPQVRARQLPARPRRRGGRGTAADPRREPAATSTTARARWSCTGCATRSARTRSTARCASSCATTPSRPRPIRPSQDLVDALRAEAPADKQQLITDLFEKITLYDLKTKTAVAKKRRRRPLGRDPDHRRQEALRRRPGQGDRGAPGRRDLRRGRLHRRARQEGLFAKNVLYLQRLPLRSGPQTVTVTVDKKPLFAGVDPYNKQIDRNSDDNDIKVTAS